MLSMIAQRAFVKVTMPWRSHTVTQLGEDDEGRSGRYPDDSPGDGVSCWCCAVD